MLCWLGWFGVGDGGKGGKMRDVVGGCGGWKGFGGGFLGVERGKRCERRYVGWVWKIYII